MVLVEIAMKYERFFAAVGDEGIVVRAAHDIEDFNEPEDWREIHDIHEHVTDYGMLKLQLDESIVFTVDDQSHPELLSLFYDAD